MHNFNVKGTTYVLNKTTVTAVFAILKLAGHMRVDTRILAIQHLRSIVPMGLFEAKQIVDFMAENASVRDGEVYMENAIPVVSYLYVAQ